MKLTEQDRAKIEAVAKAARFDFNLKWPDEVYLAGLRAGLERAAQGCEHRAKYYEDGIARGKGDWPKPDYVRDETWTQWLAKRSAHLEDAAAIRKLGEE